MTLTKEEIEFLRQSNYIEREYSEEALENSIKAWEYAKRLKFKSPNNLSLKNIREIHRRLMIRLDPDIAGKFRRIQVGVMTKEGFREAIQWYFIKQELEALCDSSLNPYYLGEEYIKDWHIAFEHIHPFEDGNGRTGRIIMNLQRLKLGLPLLIINEGYEQFEYYKWFKEEKNKCQK